MIHSKTPRLTFILLVTSTLLVISAKVNLPARLSEIVFLPTKTVTLGEAFSLRKNQTAHVDDSDILLVLKDFINSPCPTNVVCFWSGQAVIYELTVSGKIYHLSSASASSQYSGPYDVFVTKSDYQTYAQFVIDRPEAKCLRLDAGKDELCWSGLALRFNDVSYCQRISIPAEKDRCVEDLVEQSKQTDLCSTVINPKRYCQYLRLVAAENISQCDSIGIFHWRVRCYKDIAQTSGNGIQICDTLNSAQTKTCRELILGPDW